MNILWDQSKNEWLVINRGISFEEISDRLIKGDYIDILENPTRKDQNYFIMEINHYTWVVPFIVDDNGQVILKTAFPSRKLYKKYGKDENK